MWKYLFGELSCSVIQGGPLCELKLTIQYVQVNLTHKCIQYVAETIQLISSEISKIALVWLHKTLF